MLTGKCVLVISPNRLLCLGLKSILAEYFSADEVVIAGKASGVEFDHSVDYIFVHPDAFVLEQERFHGAGGSIVFLVDRDTPGQPSGRATLNVTSTESGIIEQLQQVFALDTTHKSLSRYAGLSAREIDVLKLVARGMPNKHIADRLSISMHTVISHRKNITRKLGIKTISGLTMYAVLNGLISSKDIR
ncbi:MAG TPA: LuxR C-terminal-related transcriptional regulator [Bacteroidota bacterium]|nr:LuxR C-terminal-related transcriptional regulator [Bacteroidota bacterium]